MLSVQLLQRAVDATVTVADVPELLSNVAVSPVPGAEAPDAPPEVDAQWDVSEPSHVPVPPTQKRDAMLPYAASGVIAIVCEPDGMVNVSPAVTAFAAARSSEPRNVPPELAVQNEMYEYVSVVDTFVPTVSAEFEFAPAEAAAHVPCFLVVSAAAFAVPAEPGSPVCSFTHTAAFPA